MLLTEINNLIEVHILDIIVILNFKFFRNNFILNFIFHSVIVDLIFLFFYFRICIIKFIIIILLLVF